MLTPVKRDNCRIRADLEQLSTWHQVIKLN